MPSRKKSSLAIQKSKKWTEYVAPASTRFRHVLVILSHHKLIVFLSFLVLLFPLSFVFEKYKDWDNAQMIKGLARDFPALVAEIEAVTGLDLEIKKNCMVTQEKVGSGMRTCEVRVLSDSTSTDTISKYIETVENGHILKKDRIFQNGNGFNYLYRNKDSCNVSYIGVSLSCILGVSEKNIHLAKELLTEQ